MTGHWDRKKTNMGMENTRQRETKSDNMSLPSLEILQKPNSLDSISVLFFFIFCCSLNRFCLALSICSTIKLRETLFILLYTWLYLTNKQYIYIFIIYFYYLFIQSFSRCFYPKRLTNEDIIEAIKTNKRATTCKCY